MFKFGSEQKVFHIGDISIGGHPGEYPTVMMGSIFFAGHKIVLDPLKGIFDRDKAQALLEQEAALSAANGVPYIVDVVGETGEALINYIEFVTRQTPAPVLIDSPSQKARIEAVRHFADSDVMPRLIYNSIAEDRTGEELACLKECGVKSAIVLAFSTRAMRPDAKLKMLTNELLPAAESAGVENLLIDVGVLDVPSISWACVAIREIKEKTGYPAGCAPANAIYTWEKMRARGAVSFRSAAAAVITLTQSQGADFVLYGSMRNAPWLYPAVATADALNAHAGRFSGVRPASAEHPMHKIF
ncbi:tetrahydromethanopterin S-methyltransferase subunit H [Chloroflexota bacterium]